MALKEPNKLDGRTPRWFRDWHMNHYTNDVRQLYQRTNNNRKFIFIIVAVILAGNVFLPEVGATIIKLVERLVNG